MYMSRHRAWKKYGIVTQHPKKMEPVNAEYDRVEISRGRRRKKFFPIFFSFFFFINFVSISISISLPVSFPLIRSTSETSRGHFPRGDFSCLRNLQFPGSPGSPVSKKIIIFRHRSLPIADRKSSIHGERGAKKIIPRSIAPVIVT